MAHGIGSHCTTVARGADHVLRVTYHTTAVVEVGPAGVTLNSGGYRTSTTKRRMNEAAETLGLGFKVYAKRGEWRVARNDGNDLPFVDGMVLA